MVAHQPLTVFERVITLTSTQVLSDQRIKHWAGKKVELWLFEDAQARQALAAQLQRRGIDARVRSAYKPLLHAFLEDINTAGLVSVVIEYPQHEAADPRRFLIESYPLETVLTGVEIIWVASATSGDLLAQPVYRATLNYQSGFTRTLSILAPNVLIKDIALGQPALCPTGYLQVSDPQSSRQFHAERLETEFEQAFMTIMQWVARQPWGNQDPYFERLVMRVEFPGSESFDAQGRLLASTYEALHEDLYFSVLEFFQHRSNRPAGDRGLQPGQIVPDVRAGSEVLRIRIEQYPPGSALLSLQEVEEVCVDQQDIDLSVLAEPISAEAIDAVLAEFEGSRFEALSRQGRVVRGVYHGGTLPAVVLTSGQHANEASGIVGALRGAQWLTTQPQAHFAVIPLENPDGYELFAQYRAVHPQHMHHAARYTGLGDDLEYRERAPWYEAEGRQKAVALTKAQLHLSLHGYPAHEWTRPLTGYVPRGFALWSLPKGFFLIIRYQDAYKDLALRWLEALTESISQLPGVAEFNRTQLQRYEQYLGAGGFLVKHGVACFLTKNDRQNVGVKLVTEFPDETISGKDFVFAQQLQTDTVRLAVTHWWRLFEATLTPNRI